MGTAGLIQNPYPTLNLLEPALRRRHDQKGIDALQSLYLVGASIPLDLLKDTAELPGNILHIGILQIEEPDATVLKGVDIHQLQELVDFFQPVL